MAVVRGGRTRRTLLAGFLPLLALVAGLLPGPAPAKAAPVEGAVECPTVMPKTSIRTGLVGQGLTVVRGTTPQPFAVEVLGVMPDGIAPGRDLIIVEVSDLPGGQVISAGGGIWSGMSGSPVYVDGQLLGAVSYGFSFSPSPIGGVTPAADMAELLDLSGAAARRGPTTGAAGPAKVTLSRAWRTRISDQAAAPAPRSLQRLPLPLSVSGLGRERLQRLQAEATAADLPVVAHAAAGRAVATAQAPTARPEAGGNFAASLSYGDLTTSAIGTTTYVCDQQALAFGHPFAFAGPVTLGADDATSLAIIKDQTLGPFKFATLGAPFGTVDQDRLTGVRARLGDGPATTPIVSTISNRNTGRTRTGSTQVTDPRYLPGLTPFAVLANFDSTFDELGDGRASSTWTIRGSRQGGRPFTLTRSNRWASRSDVAADPAFDLGLAVDALVNNEYERVQVRQVDFTSAVATTFAQLRIADLTVSVNGGRFVRPRLLRVPPGAIVTARVTLRPYQSSSSRTVTIPLRVPRDAAGRVGALEVVGGLELAQGGGEEAEGCLLSDAGCDAEPAASLDGVIAGIVSAPRNDSVYASLALESEEGAVSIRRARRGQLSVVTGQRAIDVIVG